MILLEGVSKAYHVRGQPPRWVLRDTTCVIRPGDRLGILGRNGSGKSTLVRMLGGVEYPTKGRIERRMSISWPLAHGIGVHSQLTGADNARFIARLYGHPPEDIVQAVDDFAELGPYMQMPIATYSAGMMSRLLLGLSLSRDDDLGAVAYAHEVWLYELARARPLLHVALAPPLLPARRAGEALSDRASPRRSVRGGGRQPGRGHRQRVGGRRTAGLEQSGR